MEWVLGWRKRAGLLIKGLYTYILYVLVQLEGAADQMHFVEKCTNKEASEHLLSNWIDQDCIFSGEFAENTFSAVLNIYDIYDKDDI